MTDAKDILHVVGFSGGIDSQAVCRWVLNRYPKESVLITNSDAGGNEHPLTTEHIKWYSENVHPIVLCNAIVADMGGGAIDKRNELGLKDDDPLTFDLLATLKGRFPSFGAQFCTEFLKLRPTRRYLEQFREKFEIILYSGKRRDESAKRANMAIERCDDFYDCIQRNPVADWTKKMCFDYVKAHGEKINPLYALGFSRVGCAPCINSSKDDILAWAKRFPEMIDKIREWERRVGRTFFFSRENSNGDLQWVDDVVAWSKTAHGGKNLDLLRAMEPPACESKYGLCD